jgi:uncharacterized protein YecE (DUF72 family)
MPPPAPDLTVAERREHAAAYIFHEIHPHLRFGTASDRYAGWIGQVYPEHYERLVSSRKRKLKGKTFEERTLPIASVADYFTHFGILEIDFTFYRPLREADGEPSNNWFVLEQYANHAPDHARFLLKAPQSYFARKLRRSEGGQAVYLDNPDFLNAKAYRHQFHEPALELLGDRLVGILFEQEYQRKNESPEPEGNIAELDAFFADYPGDAQAHLELRSPHLLVPPYFDWLESRSLGFVFSHWTWLPPLRDQWRMCGGRFTAGDRNAVVRLLTPLRTQYADAYAAAYPFDKPVPAITETPQARNMVLDVTALTYQAEGQGALLNMIANNRAWGNSPALAQAVAERVLDEEEKRA